MAEQHEHSEQHGESESSLKPSEVSELVDEYNMLPEFSYDRYDPRFANGGLPVISERPPGRLTMTFMYALIALVVGGGLLAIIVALLHG